MKFNGQSSVEVHPHSNLEELKTVTSISLFIRVDPDKDPIEDRFIFYLGDRNVRNPGKTLLCHLELMSKKTKQMPTRKNVKWIQMGAIP